MGVIARSANAEDREVAACAPVGPFISRHLPLVIVPPYKSTINLISHDKKLPKQ